MFYGIIVIALVAGLLAILVRWAEPKFAFFPTRGEDVTPASIGVPFETLSIATRDGERLHGWHISHPRATAAIIYFHGNGGNLSVWLPILVNVARQGYSVTAFDYRGYGLSTGRPSETGLYRDVDAVLDYVSRTRTDTAPVVYWGRSLGTTMAAYAATVKPPAAVILESGFPDARSLIRSSPPLAFLALFSTYRFPTADFVSRVGVPVLVLHGDRDTVVPYQLGEALFERVRAPKRFLTVAGADHNDFEPPDPHAYWTAVNEFIASARER